MRFLILLKFLLIFIYAPESHAGSKCQRALRGEQTVVVPYAERPPDLEQLLWFEGLINNFNRRVLGGGPALQTIVLGTTPSDELGYYNREKKTIEMGWNRSESIRIQTAVHAYTRAVVHNYIKNHFRDEMERTGLLKSYLALQSNLPTHDNASLVTRRSEYQRKVRQVGFHYEALAFYYESNKLALAIEEVICDLASALYTGDLSVFENLDQSWPSENHVELLNPLRGFLSPALISNYLHRGNDLWNAVLRVAVLELNESAKIGSRYRDSWGVVNLDLVNARFMRALAAELGQQEL